MSRRNEPNWLVYLILIAFLGLVVFAVMHPELTARRVIIINK